MLKFSIPWIKTITTKRATYDLPPIRTSSPSIRWYIPGQALPRSDDIYQDNLSLDQMIYTRTSSPSIWWYIPGQSLPRSDDIYQDNLSLDQMIYTGTRTTSPSIRWYIPGQALPESEEVLSFLLLNLDDTIPIQVLLQVLGCYKPLPAVGALVPGLQHVDLGLHVSVEIGLSHTSVVAHLAAKLSDT